MKLIQINLLHLPWSQFNLPSCSLNKFTSTDCFIFWWHKDYNWVRCIKLQNFTSAWCSLIKRLALSKIMLIQNTRLILCDAFLLAGAWSNIHRHVRNTQRSLSSLPFLVKSRYLISTRQFAIDARRPNFALGPRVRDLSLSHPTHAAPTTERAIGGAHFSYFGKARGVFWAYGGS